MIRRKVTDGGQEYSRQVPTTVDIIDRILDRGIVIEHHASVSVGGIDTLVAVDARYVITSCQTYLEYVAPMRVRLLDRPDALLPSPRNITSGG